MATETTKLMEFVEWEEPMELSLVSYMRLVSYMGLASFGGRVRLFPKLAQPIKRNETNSPVQFHGPSSSSVNSMGFLSLMSSMSFGGSCSVPS